MEVFFLMMGLWLMVAVALGMRKPRGLGGASLRARIDAIYGEPHEFAEVSTSDFPEADIEFYERVTKELEQRGYRKLGDVEDLTLSRIYPANRTFARMFIDSGGMIRASAYHMHPRGVVVSLLQVVQLIPRHLRVLELVTEIQGTFLVTSNTSGVDRLEPPPEAKLERMPQSTSPIEVLTRHGERITELLRTYPGRQPVAFESLADVLASMARAHIVMAKHRKKVGGISRDELERLKGRPLNSTEEAFLREVHGEPEPPKPT